MTKHAPVLSDDQFALVFEHCGRIRYPERNRLIMLLSHMAALRVGEIASLARADVVDFQGKVRAELIIRKVNSKTLDSRTVPINVKLREAIEAYLATVPADLGKDEPLIFSQKREGFDANTLCRWFRAVYRACGIEASSHSGRRGVITRLHAKGVGIKTIQEIAGHRALSSTQQYVDVTDEQRRSAVDLL